MLNNILFSPVTLEVLREVIAEITEEAVRKVLSEHGERPDETLLTTEEVCQEFKVSRITLIKYNKQGKLVPNAKAGKQFTYKRCDCQKAFRYKLKNQ